MCHDDRVVAFYSLSNATVGRDEAKGVYPNARSRKGVPREVPATLLGQFGVTNDPRYRSRGLGKSLARHALNKAYSASRHSSSALIVLDALTDAAKLFWMNHFDFRVLDESKPYGLYLRMSSIAPLAEPASTDPAESASEVTAPQSI